MLMARWTKQTQVAMNFFYFIFSLFLFGCLTTNQAQAESTSAPQQIHLQNIDKEINSLNQQLEKLRKEAFNQEMQAQPYMFDNWKEFSEDIGNAEEAERKILKLKERIQSLNELKQFLLKQPPNPSKNHEPAKHL